MAVGGTAPSLRPSRSRAGCPFFTWPRRGGMETRRGRTCRRSAAVGEVKGIFQRRGLVWTVPGRPFWGKWGSPESCFLQQESFFSFSGRFPKNLFRSSRLDRRIFFFPRNRCQSRLDGVSKGGGFIAQVARKEQVVAGGRASPHPVRPPFGTFPAWEPTGDTHRAIPTPLLAAVEAGPGSGQHRHAIWSRPS